MIEQKASGACLSEAVVPWAESLWV